MFADKKFRAE